MTTERTNRICTTCIHRKNNPGDVHITCGKAFNAEENPLAGIFAILGSVGRSTLPGPTREVDFRPKAKYWPGCGSWPANYDENIILDCAGYEKEEEKQP